MKCFLPPEGRPITTVTINMVLHNAVFLARAGPLRSDSVSLLFRAVNIVGQPVARQ
jgi:hypothetical protein